MSSGHWFICFRCWPWFKADCEFFKRDDFNELNALDASLLRVRLRKIAEELFENDSEVQERLDCMRKRSCCFSEPPNSYAISVSDRKRLRMEVERLPRKELEARARDLGIRGIRKLKKGELAEAVFGAIVWDKHTLHEQKQPPAPVDELGRFRFASRLKGWRFEPSDNQNPTVFTNIHFIDKVGGSEEDARSRAELFTGYFKNDDEMPRFWHLSASALTPVERGAAERAIDDWQELHSEDGYEAEIRARVLDKAVAYRDSMTAGDSVSEDGLVLNRESREAHYNGTKLEINEHAHFRLLARLHKSVGEVVSFQDCERAITSDFGESVGPSKEAPDKVKHAVKAIRRALVSAGADVDIKNAKGIGYKLILTTV